MFNIGFTELLIIAVIGLIVIGPEQLPDLARKLAKILNELKRAKDEIMSPVTDMTRDAREAIEKVRRDTEAQLHNQVSEMKKALPNANLEAQPHDEQHIEKKKEEDEHE